MSRKQEDTRSLACQAPRTNRTVSLQSSLTSAFSLSFVPFPLLWERKWILKSGENERLWKLGQDTEPLSVYSGDNISRGLAIARVKYSLSNRPSEYLAPGQ